MRIVIAGGTGFLGTPLVAALAADGHEVTVLSRGAAHRAGRVTTVAWTPDGRSGPWARVVDGADAVVNLAGASIASGRWSAARKRLLEESRLQATTSLVRAILEATTRPRALVSGSAVGYYGNSGDAIVDEQAAAGDDFLGRLSVAWEAAAAPAADAGVRVAWLRTGLALAPDGGVLGRMLLPFRLGIAGRFGSGRQYMPWIHRADWVALVRWILATDAAGPFNLTAPAPATNAAFTTTLARVLRRPAVLPVPGIALRVVLGELSQALLEGQRAVPSRAEALGFRFAWPALEPALRDLLR
jgi:hypothetical protein